MKLINQVLLFYLLTAPLLYGQLYSIEGKIQSKDNPLAFANVLIKNLRKGTVADEKGNYKLNGLTTGTYMLEVSFTGYIKVQKEIRITDQNTILDFQLEADSFLEEVVITGTRTFKRKTNSPVIVNILSSAALDNVQACSVSEGLKFQTGLRVETNCQTCNYTQLRINGLAGGYSQILINGRPIFSPLTGLYGLEQIPVNMIERIETIRGGGSTLYGSSAIGGVVNIITKIPKSNNIELSYLQQSIKAAANENIFNGNVTLVSKNKSAGMALFANKRTREYYDANWDNFSEIPAIENMAYGASLFYLPSENQKFEASVSHLNEYRYGGEMVDQTVHLNQQAEERTHDVWIGSLDYQINFNEHNSTLIAYLSGQRTNRDHYTGIFPDDSSAIEAHLSSPPYGISETTTLQGGTQFNHRVDRFLKGTNVFTLGGEYLREAVLDVIPAYNYNIDQTAESKALFLQSDWEIIPALSLLSGVRMEHHNLVDKLILSPRISVMYKPQPALQIRTTWSSGFRAPQAFDADLHIAFAGGGISRISLAENLKEERSNSFSTSLNYDHPTENYIFGFTLEGFYTILNDTFFLAPLGEDAFGERFEKQNGNTAKVKGITVEVRANYKKKIQLETGFNIQSSRYDSAVEVLEGLPSTREFLRTPNQYGFATLNFRPNEKFKSSFNYVYTGPMKLLHLAGAPEQNIDAFLASKAFSELGFKTSYTFGLKNTSAKLEVFGGIKNVLDAYQTDFDSGKNRDSNFVYGPAMPRTAFLGLKISSF